MFNGLLSVEVLTVIKRRIAVTVRLFPFGAGVPTGRRWEILSQTSPCSYQSRPAARIMALHSRTAVSLRPK